jgi:hypothetical protein
MRQRGVGVKKKVVFLPHRSSIFLKMHPQLVIKIVGPHASRLTVYRLLQNVPLFPDSISTYKSFLTNDRY